MALRGRADRVSCATLQAGASGQPSARNITGWSSAGDTQFGAVDVADSGDYGHSFGRWLFFKPCTLANPNIT